MSDEQSLEEFFKKVFGEKKTQKEILREYKRGIQKTKKELEKERANMNKEEKKFISDVKKYGKLNQLDIVRLKIKDVVRARTYQKKFIRMESQLDSISLQLTVLSTNHEMMTCLARISRIMKGINTKMSIPDMQKVVMQFEKESYNMKIKEEFMNDSLDDMNKDDGSEDEEKIVMQQIMDELGLDLTGKLTSPPLKKIETTDMQKRYEELKKVN